MADGIIQIKIGNLDRLKQRLAEFPMISKPIIADAINEGIASIYSFIGYNMNGTSGVFQFQYLHHKRTGLLQKSFKEGTIYAKPDSLKGSIGPHIEYAPYVYFPGEKRKYAGNPFMDRIVAATQSDVNEHFQKALAMITDKLAI